MSESVCRFTSAWTGNLYINRPRWCMPVILASSMLRQEDYELQINLGCFLWSYQKQNIHRLLIWVDLPIGSEAIVWVMDVTKLKHPSALLIPHPSGCPANPDNFSEIFQSRLQPGPFSLWLYSLLVFRHIYFNLSSQGKHLYKFLTLAKMVNSYKEVSWESWLEDWGVAFNCGYVLGERFLG